MVFSLTDSSTWFKNRCAKGMDNKALHGPGPLCWIYLILSILGIIILLLDSLKTISIKEKNKTRQIIKSIIKIIWSIFSAYFIYVGCYNCSGLYAFILTIGFGLFINFMLYLL
jgi:hypothetical protein